MDVIQLQHDDIVIPSIKTKLKYLEQSFKECDYDLYTRIIYPFEIKYKEIFKTKLSQCVFFDYTEKLLDIDEVSKIRKIMLKKIVNYIIKCNTVINEPIIRCLYDSKDKHVYHPIHYINEVTVYADYPIIDVSYILEPLLAIFTPRFSLFHVYFISNNNIYVYNKPMFKFIKYLNKNNNIDDAIVECNYFENRNRIVEIYREDDMYNESYQ